MVGDGGEKAVAVWVYLRYKYNNESHITGL